jgi:hypothetical protein
LRVWIHNKIVARFQIGSPNEMPLLTHVVEFASFVMSMEHEQR